MKFEFNTYIDLTNINDSMELDSGQVIAELKIGRWHLSLEVRGEVRVTYNPDENGSYENGVVYRWASYFPKKLLRMFHDGETADAKNVYVDENNWFELFVEKDGKSVNSEVVDAEGCGPQELFGMLVEAYKEYKACRHARKDNSNNPFNIPDLTPMNKAVAAYVKEHQGEKGFINTYDIEADIIWGYRYQEGFGETEVKEQRVVAVAFMDDKLCCLLEDNLVDEYGYPTEVTDDNIKKHLDCFESVQYSDIQYVQTIFNIAECITEYA